MEVIRIKLKQSKAAYSREETVDNRMTYPLPPFSTIIGALHNACGYTSYNKMNISVQGKYRSMGKEMYVNHKYLNRTEDDRNILVYVNNPNSLSLSYLKVAEGLKNQGNSFKNRKSIRIFNETLLEEYIRLKKISEDKTLSKDDKNKLYNIPYSHFKTLVKSPMYQEVLYDVELVIHVQAREEVMQDIMDNINNFVCLGRSEDFVDIEEVSKVILYKPNEEIYLKDGYKIYARRDLVKNESFIFNDSGNTNNAKGTLYYLNKDYKLEEKKKSFKRIFNKIPCLYSSYLSIDESSENVFFDGEYIVSLN